MRRKTQRWNVLLWLTMIAVFVAACSPSSGQNPVTTQPPQSMMTAGAGAMMTQAPGNRMGGTPGTAIPNIGMKEFDRMFIDMMVPHHQGAVEMAKIARQRAEHPEIKQMADAIVTSQQDEITQMKDWKKQWYGSSDTPPMSAMPMLQEMPGMGTAGHPMDMQAEVDQLKDAPEPFDLAFIDAMIPHHQSAIDAAKLAANQANHLEIKQLAHNITAAQQKEIDQMNAWRIAWYPDATPVATPTH